MALSPRLQSILNCWVGDTMQPRWQDLFYEGHAASSRSQKADSASCVVLRTLMPPKPVGRVAWAQAESSTRSTLRIAMRQERKSESKDSRSGDPKHGAVLSKYRILGNLSGRDAVV